MAELGKLNNLMIVKQVDFGLYLDGGDHGEILLPTRYVPNTFEIGENLEVFIYNDSEDRIIATTEKPFTMVGEFSSLEVVSVTQVGAFLNWGLPKDLFVPFSEQATRLEKGKKYLVYTYIDKETDRIVASSKINKFLDNTFPEYKEGQEVDIIIADQFELGVKAIINNLHWGLIYHSEIFTDLEYGQRLKAYIQKVREDEKIDLSLQMPGYSKIEPISDHFLNELKLNNGYLPFTDKSPAESIYNKFGISKKVFKKVVGNLYKKKIIEIKENGIHLV